MRQISVRVPNSTVCLQTKILQLCFIRQNIHAFIDCDLSQHLSKACAFIDTHLDKKEKVLVFSDLGYSRAAAVCLAYLMHKRRSGVQVSVLLSKA